MSATKKLVILFFTVALVINLQFSGTLTDGMENGFSIEQLADNIFVPSTLANESEYGRVVVFVSGETACCPKPHENCSQSTPGWDPCLY